MKNKLIRVSTVAISLDSLLKGQLSFLNKYFNIIGVSGYDKHLENVKQREKIQIIDISISRKIKLKQDIISLWKLYQCFKKEKPMIVHSITPKGGLLSMVAAYLARVPIRIHTFTGLIFPYREGFFQKILILMDKILCFCATDIIPEGKGVRQDLIEYGITSKRLTIIANGNVNGVDGEYFSPSLYNNEFCQTFRYELGVRTEDIIFIFVGRLVSDKGINELVYVFNKLSEIYSNIKLILVGEQEIELDPLNKISLSIMQENKSILTVGYQEDIRPFLVISDVFVFPSYREGFPNVVLQAGVMGLPCIVTNISGSNEIIKDNINGVIIPVKDKQKLYDEMDKFIQDKSYRQSFNSVNCREIILTNYAQEIVWQALLEKYQNAIEDYTKNK